MLVIDAGNTRVKWGLHNGSTWVIQDAVAHDEIFRIGEAARRFGDTGPAIISNVAGATLHTALQTLVDELGLKVKWVQSSARACGVNNGYVRPEQLGSDRWAALVAVWDRYRTASVIATAGTALTIDALSSSGEFLGGMIVPGLGMMKTALANSTAGILQTQGEWAEFPSSTGDAVYNGTITAMAGAVERMCRQLAQKEGAEPLLLLSGGDATLLHQALSGSGTILDNLVLEGLLLIAGELEK